MYTALGTFIALVLSLFFVPALISAFSWESKRKTVDSPETGKSFLSDYFLNPLQNLLISHTKRFLITWIILSLIGIGGIFLIQRNVDIRNYFKKGNPTRVAEDIMSKKFGGTKPIFVLVQRRYTKPGGSEYHAQNRGIHEEKPRCCLHTVCC